MENSKIDNAKKTIKEMIKQRGYKISSEDDEKIVATKSKKRICIYITNIDKFNSEKTHEYIKKLNEESTNHGIIVYNSVITSSAKKIIQNLPYGTKEHMIKMKIELFELDELQFNITKHRLQPTFQLLSSKEASEFKEKYGTKIPILLTSDPISRFFNFKVGDIIRTINKKTKFVRYRIVRKSATA